MARRDSTRQKNYDFSAAIIPPRERRGNRWYAEFLNFRGSGLNRLRAFILAPAAAICVGTPSEASGGKGQQRGGLRLWHGRDVGVAAAQFGVRSQLPLPG